MTTRALSRRILVAAEVTAVFLIPALLARSVLRSLGIQWSKDAIQGATSASFDAAAVAIPLTVRWVLVLAVAYAMGRLIGGHRLRDHGLTLANRPFGWHVRAGVVTFAIGAGPVIAVMLLRDYFHLKGGPAVWSVFDSVSWWRTDFWLFMLASAILLPPLFEELFFRGYALTRFRTVFRPTVAAVVIAVLFMLAHTQYLDGTLIGTLVFLTGIWSMSIAGLARIRTGSLIAPILAHMLVNIPMLPAVRLALLPLLIAIAIHHVRGEEYWRNPGLA